ncbi:MAG: hypothetical protein ABIR65_01175 [Pseudolysinimonas sp.]
MTPPHQADSDAVTLWCQVCHVMVPLGRATLDGGHAAAVAIEVHAAEMAANCSTGDNLAARRGWNMAASSITTIDSASELAGWLARQIHVHSEEEVP